MRYGFYLPTRGLAVTCNGVLSLASEGERLGPHSATIVVEENPSEFSENEFVQKIYLAG